MKIKSREELLENVRFAYANLEMIFASLEDGMTMREGEETLCEVIDAFSDEIAVFIKSLEELKKHHGSEQIKYFVNEINKQR